MKEFFENLIIKACVISTLVALVSACSGHGDKGNNNMLQDVIIYSPCEQRTPLVRLSIPSNYLINDAEKGVGQVKAAYPDMVSFSSKSKARFYDENGKASKDTVRIFFQILKQNNLSEENVNVNDQGLYIFDKLQKFEDPILVDNPRYFIQSKFIKTYVKQAGAGAETYVITHNSGRIAVVNCVYKNICKGNTSWNGHVSVNYRFHRKHLPEIVELDTAVFKLFNSFNPKLLKTKE